MEGLFASVRAVLPGDIAVRTHVVRFYSTGVARRVGAILDVARLRGDVVHVTGDIHFVVLGLRRRRAVLTVLDCGAAREHSGLARTVFRLVWLRWPARRAARVVAISEAVADELAALTGIGRAQIDVVPVTIDESFVQVPRPVTEPATVLCFGRTANKNLARVLQALEGLNVTLHVIGQLDPPMQDALRASTLRWANSAELSLAEMREAYVAADVVLFPSTYEGFGMPIVEAQATGRPVVTSDRAPMNEVAGGAACLVDPEDVASIRAGVERVLGDATYRAELIEAGLRNRERFRPEVAAQAYARLYREVTA